MTHPLNHRKEIFLAFEIINLKELLLKWEFFALITPLLWAITNFIDKLTVEKYTKNAHEFIFFGSIVSWFLFLIMVSIIGLPTPTLQAGIPIVLGILHVLACWFYGKALKLSDASQVIISFKLIPVLTLLFAYIFLDQTLSTSNSFAFIIVMIGTLFITLEKVQGVFTISDGTKWLLCAIVLWSAIFVGVDWALMRVSFWEYLVLNILGSSLAGTSLLLFPPYRKDLIAGMRSAPVIKYIWFGLSQSLDFVGQILIVRAFVLSASAGLVTAVMQIQSVYGILIGIGLTLWFPHIIKEDISMGNLSRKIIGTAIMLIGICLLFSN